MNAARISVLSLALIAAGAAAFLVRGIVLGQDSQVAGPVEPTIPTVGVLVTAKPLTPGQTVRSGDLRWQDWPETAVNEAQITRAVMPDARNNLDGSIARRAYGQGEPILPGALVQPGAAGLMAALVSPGMRAMAVSVSDENSAGGFILPGDRVDVVVTREMGQDRSSRTYVSETVLYNVRVLAIDQVFDEDVSGGALVGDTITLELTPGQSETLALAQAVGDVSLALRSFADMAERDETPVDLIARLLQQQDNHESRQDQSRQINLVRNGLATQVRVQQGGGQ